MKKIINNSVYDTETAARLGKYENTCDSRDFSWYSEALYRTKSGKYFLHGEGGPNSRYGVWHGNSGGYGEKIMPMTYDEATEWAQNNLDGDEYIEAFGDPEDGEKMQMAITLSRGARSKLEKIRAESGETLSAIVEKLIMEQQA